MKMSEQFEEKVHIEKNVHHIMMFAEHTTGKIICNTFIRCHCKSM